MKTWLISATLFLTYTVFVTAKPHHGPPHHDLPPEIKAAHDECLTELSLTNEQLHEARKKGEYEEKDCFHACISKKLKVITEDGNIDKEVAAKFMSPHIPQENVTTIVDTCSVEKGADDCVTAALYHKCLMKLMPRPPHHGKIKKIHDDCKSKLSLTDEDIDKLEKARDEAKEDCFIACVNEGLGFMSADGSFNRENFIEKSPRHVSKEDAQKAADECEKEQGANSCETGILLHRCLKKYDFFKHKNGHSGPPPPPSSDEE